MTDPVQLHPVEDSARECCGKCAYYFKLAEGGLCRRYPATVVVVGNSQMVGGMPQVMTQGVFPPMNPTEGWCGEFTPRIEPSSVEQVFRRDENGSFLFGPLDPPKQGLDPVVVDGPEEPVPDPGGGGQDAA